MSQYRRISIDTLYVGLKIHEIWINEFIKEIKNYLFFFDERDINFHFCRNRFYRYEYVNDDFGFYMFFCPRKNCRNDNVTLQLAGKFFKHVVLSKNFVDFILGIQDFFEQSLVVFQRVDCALDIIYDSDSGLEKDDVTNMIGFPMPSYSDKWHYQQTEFETYGRYIKPVFRINMVSCGKGDVRLRVYDKVLDLEEKYHLSYEDYYGFKIKSQYVYRIELQLRGDFLKGLIENASQKQFFYSDYFSLCDLCIQYLIKKFSFKGVFINDLNIDFSSNIHKKNSSLDDQLDYYKKQMFSFYDKYLKKYDEIKFFEKEELKWRNILAQDWDKEIERLNDIHDRYYPPLTESFHQGYLDLQSEFEKNKDLENKKGFKFKKRYF